MRTSAPIRSENTTVTWLTPPHVIAALGPFDLDPCGHPLSDTAARRIVLPEDGLAAEWHGRVWLNPPYGAQITRWLKRMADHGSGVALLPARTEVTSWFCPFVWERATALLFLRGRLSFGTDAGTLKGNAGHASVLAAYSVDDAMCLQECSLPGYFVQRPAHTPRAAKINPAFAKA